MFDIGFSELVLIFIVGLLVLGPERLPGVIKTGSVWLAKLRRSFNDVRSDIEREIGYDEIKREIHNQAVLDDLRKVRDELHETNQQLQSAQRDLTQFPYDTKPLGKNSDADSAPTSPKPPTQPDDQRPT